MPYVHNNQRRYAISRVAQANYNTPTPPNGAAPFNYVQLLLKDTPGQNFANYGVRTQNNQGYSTGSDFATEQWLTAHDVDRQGMDFDLASETIGRLLFYALGSVATQSPAPGVYEHTFVPQEPNAATRQLPSFSYLEQIGAEHDVLYPSCVIDTLSLSGDGLNRIMGSAGFRGSGKRVSPSGIDFATQTGLAENLNYLYNTQTFINIVPETGNGPGLVYECDYNNFSFAVRNGLNPDSGYRPGCGNYQIGDDKTSGIVRSEMLFGQREIDFSFTVRLNQSSKEFQYLQTQRILTGSISLTGATISGAHKHSLNIWFDRVAVETAVIGAETDNIVTLQVSLNPLVNPAVPSRAVQVRVKNTVASYLV